MRSGRFVLGRAALVSRELRGKSAVRDLTIQWPSVMLQRASRMPRHRDLVLQRRSLMSREPSAVMPDGGAE
jgi:hypothetical protein